jgi:uncharacterized protein YdeI (YjbR/CyaY-like superfamily)
VGTRDPRVDAYIAKQREFAKPILAYLRDVVHEGCPDCEETLKWGAPSFMYHGMLGGFAAFKEHAVFGFWKHENLLGKDRGGAMGSFGRLTSVKDLPPKKELLRLVKRAVELNEQGVKPLWMARRGKKAPIAMPADFKAALARSRKAKAAFDAFSPSHRREYLEWITEAKRDETRARRIKQAIQWIAEGKSRNWKYA